MARSGKKSGTRSKVSITKSKKCRISKLPDDVLCKIFHLLRLGPPVFKPNTFFSFWEYQKKALGWVTVSWVCRHWRAMALNDPTLWAEPPLHFPRWTIEMLQRSKNTGLSVELARTPNNTILSALFGQPLRIAQLTMSDEKLKMLLSDFPLSSAPMLERLCIKKSTYGRMEETAPNFQLPNTLFVDAIQLRHLELAGVDIDWGSHLLARALAVLDLGQISLTARPTMETLRILLSRMSTLRTLRLHQALPVGYDISSPTPEVAPISLSSLQHLSIGYKPLEIAAFFNNIALSSCIRNVNIVASLENGPNQDLDRLLVSLRRTEALGRFVLSAQSSAIEGEINGIISEGKWQDFNLEINATEVLTSSLAEETSEDDLPGLDLKIRSKLRMSTSTSAAARPFRCVFKDVFNTFEWLNLQELALVNLDVKSYPDFSHVLAITVGALPRIRAIAIGPKCVHHLLGALIHNPVSSTPSTTTTFPRLTEVIMVEISLQSYLALIVGTLSSRKKRGVPMRKIQFEDCRGKTNNFMQLLKEVVGEIEWDGIQI